MLEPRMWIKKGSKAYVELSSIVESKYLMKDIGKLSYQKQTSFIEGFHQVVILSAPKHTHFFYRSMEARLFIAALHFNENGNNVQKTKNGGQTEEASIRRVAYSKSKEGQGVIKPVKVDSTYGYVKDLMKELLYYCRRINPTLSKALYVAGVKEIPVPLTGHKSKISKAEAIKQHKSRFNK
ncbi:uncharacterized protein LOC124458190 [Xenia sp. Carnegie-2017]|uniref:uncharacterized protein LOC124458190 n=1 Tax=Xenia sp. Carnegie-2017 TaxID=2897299 RepID=UPI001F035496|nr:uncharacterized protein LOC124458190 [Xenia sp. Carnegie-2017]